MRVSDTRIYLSELHRTHAFVHAGGMTSLLVDSALKVPADGMSLPGCPRDFGTSRPQLLEKATPPYRA